MFVASRPIRCAENCGHAAWVSPGLCRADRRTGDPCPNCPGKVWAQVDGGLRAGVSITRILGASLTDSKRVERETPRKVPRPNILKRCRRRVSPTRRRTFRGLASSLPKLAIAHLMQNGYERLGGYEIRRSSASSFLFSVRTGLPPDLDGKFGPHILPLVVDRHKRDREPRSLRQTG
jgi:hypothetical protein